ncbi:unnamed protein product, partial [Onchocerca ochengi]
KGVEEKCRNRTMTGKGELGKSYNRITGARIRRKGNRKFKKENQTSKIDDEKGKENVGKEGLLK